MTFWILAAGLFFLPLTNVIIFEPIISITHNTKEILALMICLIFSTYVFNFERGHMKKINVSLASTIVFLIFCINASPKVKLLYGTENLGNLWEWKAFATILVYYLFYLAFSHIHLSSKQKDNLCRIIGLTAILSSIYAIFQALGLDQAQSSKTIFQVGHVEAREVVAMIGNPTYLSIYLVACIPFVWHFFKKVAILPVIAAIVLCRSDTGYLGLFLMVLIWTFIQAGKTIRILLSLCLVTLVCIVVSSNYGKLQDNGRFSQWKQTLSEFYNPQLTMQATPDMSTAQKEEIRKLNSKKYVMTGLGLGSFPIVRNGNKKFQYAGSAWTSCHNIYLDVLFATGIIGLLLFLSAIVEAFISFNFRLMNDKTDFLILISFIFLLLASFLHSTINIEPLRFLMATLFCLISL